VAALKVLVGVMGVMIVVGVGVLIWGIATRLDLSKTPAVEGRVALPAGATVLDMTSSGDRLVLRVALPDRSERLIIVDLARGRPLGSLELVRP
jgi:hypothetical protein